MKRIAWLAAGALAAAAVLAAGPRPAAADDPVVKFERYTLPNGIEVILHQDNRVPLVAVDLWYHVGSGDDSPHKSGFAHLFEHMLFQGSKHTGEDVYFDILRKLGASSVNASTTTDRTNFFEVVPSNQLETALWLESDRMGYLLPMLTKPSVDNQREVVRNERRQNYDNQPYRLALFELFRMLYPDGHPYRYLTIGLHEDLAQASVEDIAGFYKKWYAPANATITLAGDFEIDAAKKLVDKWFGDFPKSERPRHLVPPMPVVSHTRHEVKDKLAKLRRIEYAWHTPAKFAQGDAELDILSHALANPGTGRLYKILVHDKQLAQSVNAFQNSMQFSSIFEVVVMVKSDADLGEVEKVIEQEVERARAEPITQREFDRAVTSIEAGFVWDLEGLLDRAELLQTYNHYIGRPDYITEDLDRYRKSSTARVRDVAAKFLAKDHRIEVLTTPAEGGK